MKAIVLNAPGEFHVQNIEKPNCPSGGLLIKVHYCGLCGSDLRTLFNGHSKIKLPAVIGHEVSGEIVEVAPDCHYNYKVGELLAVAPMVYCDSCEFCRMGQYEFCENARELAQHWAGGFAEYMAIPKESLIKGTIQRIPEGLDAKYACIAEPPSSCVNAQEKLNVHLGDTVLIIGAGPIGNIHICVARARGAKRVFIADVMESRLKISENFGPDATIDSSKVDLVEEVNRLTDGRGPDVVITANPVAITQLQALEVARKGGRIAFFGGLPHGNSTVTIDTNIIHYKGLSVIGTTGFAPRHHIQSLDLLLSGRIPGDKLVTHVLPLDDFAKGVELAKTGKAMKVVFDIHGSTTK